MKNIRVYEFFLDNLDKSFKMRYVHISLTRTYVYNLGKNKTIYYRKKGLVPRKIFLCGKEKIFSSSKIDFKNFNYKKYKMKNIINIIYEYLLIDEQKDFEKNNSFDIAKRESHQPKLIDSFIRNDNDEEVVVMCFDDSSKKKNKLKNIFWIDENNYSYLNLE